MQNKKLSFPFEICATQSLMAQKIALNELAQIKEELKQMNEPRLTKNHNFRHGLWLTVNGLESRQMNLYTVTRRTPATDADAKTVKRLLNEVAEGLSPDVETLKRCIAKYVAYNDCVYEKLIAMLLVVGTMLHHAVEVLSLVDNPWQYLKEGYDIYKTLDRIKPSQEKRNFENAVEALQILPQDLNYMADMDVHNSVLVIANKMAQDFVLKFTNMAKNGKNVAG